MRGFAGRANPGWWARCASVRGAAVVRTLRRMTSHAATTARSELLSHRDRQFRGTRSGAADRPGRDVPPHSWEPGVPDSWDTSRVNVSAGQTVHEDVGCPLQTVRIEQSQI